jgi:thiaminase
MKALLQDSVKDLSHALTQFPWTTKRAYADWLAQTYYYVCHSTRLLAAAAARFPYDERGNQLHHRFAKHMAEEKKHELLAVSDIRVLGETIESLPEHPSTRMFYETQYFKIEHQSPVTLFGYILPLEAIPPVQGPLMIEKVTGAYGPKCASFVKLHAGEDVDHLEKALAMLDSLDALDKQRVEDNLRQTTYAYVAMLHDIRRRLDMPARGPT